MPHRSMLLLFLAANSSWSQPPAIPDTPAGHTLQAWFDAFNSGDRARIQAYLAKYDPTRPLEPTLGFRAQTGGFDLLGIDKSDPLHIEFRVKEKAGPTNAVGKLEVKDGDPAQVVSFGVRAIPPGMTAADMNPKIDAATRSRVIDGAISNLNEFYVYPEVAKKMEDAIRTRQKKGEYDSVDQAEAFASLLTSSCGRSATTSTWVSIFLPPYCRAALLRRLPRRKRACAPSWNATTAFSIGWSGLRPTSAT